MLEQRRYCKPLVGKTSVATQNFVWEFLTNYVFSAEYISYLGAGLIRFNKPGVEGIPGLTSEFNGDWQVDSKFLSYETNILFS